MFRFFFRGANVVPRGQALGGKGGNSAVATVLDAVGTGALGALVNAEWPSSKLQSDD
jgi:hypothetical protein